MIGRSICCGHVVRVANPAKVGGGGAVGDSWGLNMCSVAFLGRWTERDCLKLGVQLCMPACFGHYQLAVVLVKWVKIKLMRSNWSVSTPIPWNGPCVCSWPSMEMLVMLGSQSFVLMVFIVLPNFAVCSRAVSRGILISLSQLALLQQYVGTVCALAQQPFPLPLGKSRVHLAKSPHSLVEHLFTTKFCVIPCRRECLC